MNTAYKKLAALGLVTAVGLFVPSMPGLAQINTESQRAEVKTLDASYFLDLANVALSDRDYQNAIYHANKALQLEPDLAKVYLLRARAQEKLGQFQAAIEDLYAAAQLYEEENNQEGEAIARQMILDIR
ncbi:MAG: tetratricopeptide repeat protein [Cyanobacteriota bacterium]|nr:tetratricopeptide repeat protein [Cyanobacteriota bacterium]